jgi:DNA-binding CsgD family transcriptional regulator
MPLRLVCTDGSLEHGPQYLEEGQVYQVGRSSRSSFVVNDLSVSRRHAEIVASKDVVVITDLGSRNGTHIERTRLKIGEPKEAEQGQVIFFANAQFIIMGEKFNENQEMSEFSTAVIHHPPKGEPPAMKDLTKAERSVLEHLLEGMGEKETADKLFRSQHTVHDHIKSIYKKLGVNSRPELLALFMPDTKQ